MYVDSDFVLAVRHKFGNVQSSQCWKQNNWFRSESG